jgi:lipid-binding SYLF domain-containing protein
MVPSRRHFMEETMNAIRITAVALMLGSLVLGASPARADLKSELDFAVGILERMPPGAIPQEVLAKAHGLVIVQWFKLGAVFGLAGGQGIVVARTPSGWSPPSGIGAGALSFGLQLGARNSDLVFVLNTPAAVEAFSKGSFDFGAEASLAFLKWGAMSSAGVTSDAAVYVYGDTLGLFAGGSLDAGYIAVRDKDNAKAYGKSVPAMSILRGEVEAPPGTAKLQEALAKLE